MTLLQSASKTHYESGFIKANVATSDELWYNTSSLADPLSYSTGLTEDQLASYMIRGNYNYKDKYLATTASVGMAAPVWPSITSGPASPRSHWDGESTRKAS